MEHKIIVTDRFPFAGGPRTPVEVEITPNNTRVRVSLLCSGEEAMTVPVDVDLFYLRQIVDAAVSLERAARRRFDMERV